ncbi:hypothetical protein ACWEFJ_01650 [Actinosynnema sp. NPDC004786]
MTDIKQVLAVAVADEPPMAVDKAALVARGRRRVAFRRGSLVAVALVAAGAVVLPVALWPVGDVPVAGSSTSPFASPSASVHMLGVLPLPNEPGSTPPRPVTAERAAELTAALRAALPADVVAKPLDGRPPLELVVPEDVPQTYFSYTDVTTSRGRGSVAVMIRMGTAGQDCLLIDQTRCEEWDEGGRHFRLHRPLLPAGEVIELVVRQPDGSAVTVLSAGSRLDGQERGGPAPLDYGEVLKLATSAGLGF